MKNNKLLISLAISAFTSCAFAADDDKIDYSLSVKSWQNNINVSNSTFNVTTQAANSPIVTLTAKKGDYFVSTNLMLQSAYSYRTAYMLRKDVDLTLGYQYKNNLSFVVGQSYITVKDGTLSNWVDKYSGYFLGVSGFEMLSDKVYATASYKNMPSLKNSGTGTDKYKDTKGYSAEVGLGYTLNNTTQLTAGYRFQQIKNYNITQTRNESNTIKGILAGVNVNF
jgi:hypothetical protein